MKADELEREPVMLRKHFFPAEYPPANGKAPKLAIVSAYDCLCGIAEYAYFVAQSLRKFADVTIFVLDQEVFKCGSASSRADADHLLREICSELPSFDSVNLQFEPGTLGPSSRSAYHRFTQIVDASPDISVTFHTFLDDVKESRGFWNELRRFRLTAAFFGRSRSTSRYYLTTKPVAYLKNANKTKRATCIVHTKREVERLVRRHGFNRRLVFDHPLSYLSDAEVNQLKGSRMLQTLGLPSETVLLGVFGFISEYKGADLAVDVLRMLPDNYHLVIAGGVHPHEAKHCVKKLNPFVQEIMAKILGQNSLDDPTQIQPSILERVHFLGAQERDEFLQIMKDCDVVLLPYREIGQTSSGPISMAVDLKKRIIASRTAGFLEFAKYFPNRLEMFDQNNFIELGQRIRSPQHLEKRSVACSWKTNAATYFSASGFAAVAENQWREYEADNSPDSPVEESIEMELSKVEAA
ncbi:hypothetical protein C5Y93_15800 [Blastopirellula marina]|uniref:Glycosyl transferase family 1 domain-containing protein n=2 Tax=Blastopirellula marina TaxID=124 RepID=A0A2S8GKM9_9BACT|nr:hypothetical protein C5Y93_15800 [Blastopirellula marina]